MITKAEKDAFRRRLKEERELEDRIGKSLDKMMAPNGCPHCGRDNFSPTDYCGASVLECNSCGLMWVRAPKC